MILKKKFPKPSHLANGLHCVLVHGKFKNLYEL